MLAGLALVSVPLWAAGQAGGAATGSSPAAARQPQSAPQSATPQSGSSATNTDGSENPPSTQQPIVVTSPEQPPAPWSWHDRALWGAYLLLALLGYVGIMLALRTLKRMERHMEVGAATAQAALDAADAALVQSQAMHEAERPWILVTVEPFVTMENTFKVMATNKGKTPARIVGTVDLVGVAPDERHLPETPVFENDEPGALLQPVVLLPGESLGIRRFGRSEVKEICKTRAELERIELWEDKIFVFGRVSYRDLVEVPGKKAFQTDWCCSYIHGEKDSAMVVSGPPKYNKHT
ncbi:MAG TPA: hypothetical protein VFU68_05715 [Terracidiphilus sp.]|nr:hypothetical protein [Terracidiphilus sp.]